jgi:ferrous-iron efflux pump FieF
MNETVGYGVILLSLAMTFALLRLQRYVVRRTGSLAIGADRLHYTGDLLMNAGVAASLAIQQVTDLPWIDPLFALGVAAILINGAIRISRLSLNVLMDKEMPEKDLKAIAALARETPGVIGVHDLRTRTDSGRLFVEIHIEMDPDITLRAAHDITEAVIGRIESQYPGADILVHQDPAGVQETRRDVLIESAEPPSNAK